MTNDELVTIIHKSARTMANQAKQIAEDLEWLSNYNADYDTFTYQNVRGKIAVSLLNLTMHISMLPTFEHNAN